MYDTLLSQLISLKIAPGSRISVDALVRDLSVSQTPIRAALIRLESEGLVVKTHNVGYSAAAMPTRQRFEEIYDLRTLLEPYMAARAATRLTDVQRQELTAQADRMAAPFSDDAKVAYGKFARHDADFHSWIADHGDNDLAADTLGRLHAHMHLFRLRFHSHVTEEAIKEHAAIVDALVNGNPDKAAAAMKKHIARSRDRLAPFFDTTG
ncbi:GntR family transcriptional regulator [Caballeronia sp. LZ035]|uniref:GntR family transcriptional regulator n=1 Tax=Caballeronia sp. LZ035 TaxID=3038568 RepID=UPI0028663C79|nr:GntR family transcriptional regulator [Caballeronia sp. LZ035]MDR5758929.1 GntR family transcriptional regulator [Caballeronia sp. LZ035]